ncbi:MAG: hypothetical protein JSV09_03525 [Thermoplasmata archaeon]|nr:MAG: hypothetical protein JSV09_03525 [Thermoplasmata archaeon]
MEGGKLKTAFFVLILGSLALFTVFSTTTGDFWVQTDQGDFEEGDLVKVDTITDPGNVTLSKVWTKAPTDGVMDVGTFGEWDDEKIIAPSVVYDGVTYHMWYSANDGTNARIGYATSPDGYQWTKYDDPATTMPPFAESDPVLDLGPPGSWDDFSVYFPSVIYNGLGFEMYYSGDDTNNIRIGYATSPDGTTWTKYDDPLTTLPPYANSDPVLDVGTPESYENKHVYHPSVLYDGLIYHMWYTGNNNSNSRIGYATSPDGVTWNKYAENPVLDLGPPDSWDDFHVASPTVHYNGSAFHMWYSGYDGSVTGIGYANSTDGMNWTKSPGNPVMNVGLPGTWDSEHVNSPTVISDGSIYRMWYTGWYGGTPRIGYAESDDGYTWTKMPSVPVLDVGIPLAWDDYRVTGPSVVYDGATYHMWYTGHDGGGSTRIGHATSPDGYQWTKDGANPVLDLGPSGSWDDWQVYAPSVIYIGSGFEMWYSGSDGNTVRIGYATSPDGITWTKYDDPLTTSPLYIESDPVLDVGAPDSFEYHNVFHPSVLYDGLIYHMWYTGYNLSNLRIGYATSPDGVAWNKYAGNPVLDLGPPDSWDDFHVLSPTVHYNGSTFQMWYTGHDGSVQEIGYANSTDGINWTKNAENPVMKVGLPGTWEGAHVCYPTVIFDGYTYRMWYTGSVGSIPRIGYAELLYNQRGNLTSSVFDSGVNGTIWNSINWTENLPAKTNITVATRTGDVPVPDGSWSTWSPEMWDETSLPITSPRSRYIQYRATLYTSSRYVTPTLSEVSINYSYNTAQPPTLSLPLNKMLTSDGTPTFEWIFNDPEGDSQGEFEVQVDDDPLFSSVDYSSGNVVSILEEWTPGAPISDGIWFWRVRTMDEYGLWSSWSENWTVTIDTTPPEPFVPAANPSSWTNNTQPEITFSTIDSLSGISHCEVRIDTGGFITQASPYMLPSQSDGIHNITVRAFDMAGNYRDGYVEVFIDTTPPVAPGDIITIPDTWTNTNSFSINWTYPFEVNTSGIKNGAWYKIGSPPVNDSDGTWQANKPITVTSIEGAQTLYIWLEDNLGNVDYNNHASTTLYLDTTPPAPPTGLTASPSSWTIANSFSIDWIDPADDSGVRNGAWYKIDTPPSSESDGIWFDDKPISIMSLEGEHTVYIWLEDNLGNTNHLNYSTVVLYLDSAAPIIIHTPVTKADIGKDLTITATVTDNVAVKSARLHYRKPGDETFEIIGMSNVGDVYSAVIPSSFVTIDGIEYYISASDEINTATHPSSNAITEPLPIEVEDDEEPWFISLWWLFLLLAIILIILFLLLALRRDEEEGGNGAIAQEEPVSEHMGDTTIGEEPTLPETAVHETPEREPVPPTPPPSMSDEEIFDQIMQLHEKGELSDETFEDIKKRYGK